MKTIYAEIEYLERYDDILSEPTLIWEFEGTIEELQNKLDWLREDGNTIYSVTDENGEEIEGIEY